MALHPPLLKFSQYQEATYISHQYKATHPPLINLLSQSFKFVDKEAYGATHNNIVHLKKDQNFVHDDQFVISHIF